MPEASITLEVSVVYVNVLPQRTYYCVVDVTVRAGNGYVRGHQSRDKSGNPQKACNAAHSREAFRLLSDPLLQSYLAGSC